MNTNYMKVLSADEIEQIHTKTLELLEEIGVKVETEEARNLLEEHGAIVNEDGENFVKFPEELVMEQLEKVPSEFSLWGPDGSFRLDIDTKSVNFATVGTPVKTYDPREKNDVRKSVLEDTIKQIRIVDTLDNIHCSHVDVWPNDVPFTELHWHTMYA